MTHKNWPIKDYKGKHWTQLPGGKEKMAAVQKRLHEAKRAKKLQAMAKEVVVAAKRGPYRKRLESVQVHTDETVLSINGWKVTLGRNTVRIEHE